MGTSSAFAQEDWKVDRLSYVGRNEFSGTEAQDPDGYISYQISNVENRKTLPEEVRQPNVLKRYPDSTQAAVENAGVSIVASTQLNCVSGTVLDIGDERVLVEIERPGREREELSFSKALFPDDTLYADRFKLTISKINGYRSPCIEILPRGEAFFPESEETEESLRLKEIFSRI